MFAGHRRGRLPRTTDLTRAGALVVALALIGAATVATAASSLAEETEGPPSKVITSVKAPFVTPPTCKSDGLLVIQDQEHIKYTTDPALAEGAPAQPGTTYTITATIKGREWAIAPGATTVWQLTPLEQLSEEQCAAAGPIDLCSDLPGVQETIPAGMVPKADGTCAPKAADEGELKPRITLTAGCRTATWTVKNPNQLEEGEEGSNGGKPIHFFILIDGKKTSATPTVLLPQQSASGVEEFAANSGSHTVTINAGNGRAGGGSGSGSGGEGGTPGHTGGSGGGEEGHGPAATETVSVSTACSTSVSPPVSSVVGPARPTATIVVASCSAATITLANPTVYSTDASATFTFTANGTPSGSPVTVNAGYTQSLTYTRPANIEKAIHLEVLAGATVIAKGTMAACAEVEGIVIPGAAPATVEATTVAADTATLPETGAGSSASLALAGAGILALGGLLVAWSLRRPEEGPTL